MKPLTTKLIAAGALLCALAAPVRATLFRHITGETGSPTNAVINSDGSLTESGVTYACIYKPVPQASWVRTPWLSPSQHYVGAHAIGMEIDSSSDPTTPTVDKVNHRLCSGNDSFALTWGVKRYTGFALELPSANFQIPLAGKKLMLAQWWQGSPYGPPVRIAITNDTTSVVTFRVWVLNNDTLGNPSSVPIDIGGGTIPFDTWTTFVVMLIPDYTGSGQIKVWLNGTQIIYWTGKVGYDPSTIPYNNPPPGTNPPNNSFDVFYGPYRDRQTTKQQVFYDEIKFADTFSEASP
jgi:hypothetical protein